MFELPWRIDSPIPIALFLLPVTGLFLYLRFILSKEHGRFRKAVEFLLAKWRVNLPHEKKLSVFRSYLMGMAVIFGFMAIFSFAVGIGLIKNKEEWKPMTLEDIEQLERILGDPGLEKDPQPADRGDAIDRAPQP